jgi:hydrogenase expression/formation protein HypE
MDRTQTKPGGRIDLTHGAGGKASAQLVDRLFRPAFASAALDEGGDCARLAISLAPGERLALSTDSYVITPVFFPGGDIGSLAVHGTVNDLAMGGAQARYLTAGFIIEEGFPLADLERIVLSMAAAARGAGVAIVTGDTKVVARGQADGIFINTAGVGVIPAHLELAPSRVRPGDAVIVSGSIGDHGVAVMASRAGLGFETDILSDSAALNTLADALLAAAPGTRALRDPTRGGLAASLNEIAHASGCGFLMEEGALPVTPQVAGACELLGLDPLHVANEGKFVAFVPQAEEEAALAALRAHPLGRKASLAGRAVADKDRFVRMRTVFGGERMIDWLAGEQLPRIC